MVKVKLDSTKAICQKPGCGMSPVHRHHLGHEKLWVNIFEFGKAKDPKYNRFVKRYKAFRDQDCVCLCARHHAEIHWMYKLYIREYFGELHKVAEECSWKEAEKLMSILSGVCSEWLKIRTPGVEPYYAGWAE